MSTKPVLKGTGRRSSFPSDMAPVVVCLSDLRLASLHIIVQVLKMHSSLDRYVASRQKSAPSAPMYDSNLLSTAYSADMSAMWLRVMK